MKQFILDYKSRLIESLEMDAIESIPELGAALIQAWQDHKFVYLCGNGGSAGNAVHLANDLIYGAGTQVGRGISVEALSANPAVLTCLANDLGYEEVYAYQLKVKAKPGDVLIALSGSGNSPNIVKALEMGNQLGMKTFAILGFSGGLCKQIANVPLHFPIHDMQIAEDLQLIVGHMCMQWLCGQLAQQSKLNVSNGAVTEKSLSTSSRGAEA